VQQAGKNAILCTSRRRNAVTIARHQPLAHTKAGGQQIPMMELCRCNPRHKSSQRRDGDGEGGGWDRPYTVVGKRFPALLALQNAQPPPNKAACRLDMLLQIHKPSIRNKQAGRRLTNEASNATTHTHHNAFDCRPFKPFLIAFVTAPVGWPRIKHATPRSGDRKQAKEDEEGEEDEDRGAAASARLMLPINLQHVGVASRPRDTRPPATVSRVPFPDEFSHRLLPSVTTLRPAAASHNTFPLHAHCP
jgi:hypothetical protein